MVDEVADDFIDGVVSADILAHAEHGAIHGECTCGMGPSGLLEGALLFADLVKHMAYQGWIEYFCIDDPYLCFVVKGRLAAQAAGGG